MPLAHCSRHDDSETGDNWHTATPVTVQPWTIPWCVHHFPAWLGRIVAVVAGPRLVGVGFGLYQRDRRSGHEVILDLPVLAPSFRIFTPSDHGALELAMHPTFKPVPYGVNQWNGGNGGAYVLPLLSIFDPASDTRLDDRPAA